ncbi:hypothetical protein [Hyphomicrobium sp.]|uniref:hypothetical protein n=1 Tax=Hyphomicrobium sp. TaxID=82 RepID=UPI0025B8ED03|nr:hypothetical protein [Hyphomicrobium sp.]MCC7253830.1 hypothetical protein [Hyphomicrobium sp.]
MTLPLNAPDLCAICRRRSDNIAVGRAPDNLAWTCTDCLPAAKEAIRMPKDFDRIEQRAVEKVAAQLPADQFAFPADELPQFVRYVLDDFAARLRAELASNEAPF